MKTTLSLFLYGVLSATAAVAAPTDSKNPIELTFDAIKSDFAPIGSRSPVNMSQPFANTTVPATPTNINLTMIDVNDVHYSLTNFPVSTQLYAIGGGHEIETVYPWADFDNVWCGFGGATVPNLEYGSDNETHFSPPFVVTKIKCCPDEVQCSIE